MDDHAYGMPARAVPGQLQKGLDRLEILQAVTAELGNCASVEDVMTVVVEQGRQAVGARSCIVGLLACDGCTFDVIRSHFSGEARTAAGEQSRVQSDEAMLLSEILSGDSESLLRDGERLRSKYPPDLSTADEIGIGLPLRARGNIFGAIYFSLPASRINQEEDHAFLLILAHQCGLALEWARLYADAQGEIVKRAHSEIALRESEQRFRATFEQAAVGIAHVSPDGTWLRVNQRLCDIVGYTRDELLARTFQEVTFPGDLQADLAQARRLLAGEITTYSLEKRYVRKNGSLVWVNLTGSVVRNENGAVDYLIGVVEDITERRRAEAALKSKEERFRIAAEIGGDLIFAWDPEKDVYTSLYGDLEWLLGMEPGETLVQFEEFLAFVHPDDVSILTDFVTRFQSESLNHGEAEYRLIRRSGEVLYVSGRVRIERGADGRMTRMIGVVADITERKRVEMEKEATARENARLLRAAAEAAERQQAFFRDVLYSVTDGRLRLCYRREDLPEPMPGDDEPILLSNAVLRALRGKVEETAIACGLPDERWYDLVSAVGECAMNAIQHGGGRATARICCDCGRVQVWIEDRGKGINVADLPKATLLKGHSGAASFGHGFYMMLQTVDTVYLLTGPNGTTIVLEQSAVAPEPAWLQNALDNLC